MRAWLRNRADSRGQALVEFSIAFIVFMALLMAVVDLGRGIYMYNGVSQAAREIARTTSVHPGTPLGDSAETAETIAVQQNLVPALAVDGFDCVDFDDDPVPGATCFPGSRVKVTVHADFSPAFGLLQSWFGTFVFASSSTIEITNQ